MAYKVHADKMTQKKGVRSIDVATSLGIHPVMLYRWRQEFKEGRLSEGRLTGHPTKANRTPNRVSFEKESGS
ncbi:transposase [Saccharospirillum alexandrii]|uniref:transposase n=1 Tax=Saccharospirillum alexandrii TaxID=2448477 RepID=UPI003735AC3C